MSKLDMKNQKMIFLTNLPTFQFTGNEKFFCTNFIEIRQIGKLLPKTSHYVLKFGKFRGTTVTLSFDNCRSQSFSC